MVQAISDIGGTALIRRLVQQITIFTKRHMHGPFLSNERRRSEVLPAGSAAKITGPKDLNMQRKP